MNTSPIRRRQFPAASLVVLALLFLAIPDTASAVTGRAVRVTARTGVVTLLPRQTLRLHLIDAGTGAALPIQVILDLRDDKGNLLFTTGPAPRTVRPSLPINIVLPSATLLGTSSFRYIRAQVQVDTNLDNLASVPMFSLEIQNSAFGLTILQCALPGKIDPVSSIDPVQPQPPVDPAAPPPAVPLLESPYEPDVSTPITESSIAGDCYVVRTRTH